MSRRADYARLTGEPAKAEYWQHPGVATTISVVAEGSPQRRCRAVERLRQVCGTNSPCMRRRM